MLAGQGITSDQPDTCMKQGTGCACIPGPVDTWCRVVPDAFGTADDDVDGVGRTLTNQKSKKSQRDPSLQQAEQILAAGSDAMMLQQ